MNMLHEAQYHLASLAGPFETTVTLSWFLPLVLPLEDTLLCLTVSRDGAKYI